MRNLKLKTKKQVNINDLKKLEKAKIIPDTHKILKEHFQMVIDYNRKNINNDMVLKENLDVLKSKISAENKRKLNIYLLKCKTNKILKVSIDKNFNLIKDEKLYLIDIYSLFHEKFLYRKKIPTISYVKIYDYYNDTNDLNETINLINNKNCSNFIKKIFDKNEKADIKILTHLNTEKSFDLYKGIHDYDNNIEIKYIPESASQNIYIPSLFYMIIKYKAINSNYKYIVAYLEPNTNWGIVAESFSVGASSDFIKILNKRFDEQFNNNYELAFEPDDNKLNDRNFKSDIENIFRMLDKELKEDNQKINRDILNKIHKLKTNYKTINYAYKLTKSLFYNISYLNIIKNITKNKKLIHTLDVLKVIENNKYISKMGDIKKDIFNNHTEKNVFIKYVDDKVLRYAVINEINNKKAICDIFHNMNWTNKEKIINNLNYIYNNENSLIHLYKELEIEKDKITDNEKENFKNAFINYLKGEKNIMIN